MSEFAPVFTLEDLDTLDDAEIVAGYYSACDGDGEPGNNHSRSFWHGWRNGAMDRGFLPHDWASAALAKAYLARQRSITALSSEAR